MDLINIILTSALVSGLISGIFLLINDWLRRKSEEKRVILETAIKLTKMRDEQIGEILKRTSKRVLWPSALSTFKKTFQEVQNIWNGKYQKNNRPPLEA